MPNCTYFFTILWSTQGQLAIALNMWQQNGNHKHMLPRSMRTEGFD